MKKLILSFAVLALLSVPVSTNADAPAAKTDVCHVNSANDVLEEPVLGLLIFGRAISVNDKAVAAHEAHGDDTNFFGLDADFRDFLELNNGISLPNANCFFLVNG